MVLKRQISEKKAQSALEFLTTYGWAFLVILIMIGALSYFGVLDPSRFLPDKCLFGAGIGACQEANAMGTSVTFKITNNLGAPVTLWNGNGTQAAITGISNPCTSTNISGLYTGASSGLGNFLYTIGTWNVSQTIYVNVTCVGGSILVGERPNLDVAIAYTPIGLSYQKVISGTISVKRVQ